MKHFKHTQSFMLSAGRYACYALQIVHIAQSLGIKVNELDALEDGILKGYIYFNEANYEDDGNFFVNDPAGFLSFLTGMKWTMRREGNTYKAKDGEYVINFWAKNDVNNAKGIGHFDAPDCHTLQNSVTVQVGKVYSTRVFKRG